MNHCDSGHCSYTRTNTVKSTLVRWQQYYALYSTSDCAKMVTGKAAVKVSSMLEQHASRYILHPPPTTQQVGEHYVSYCTFNKCKACEDEDDLEKFHHDEL